MTMHEGNIPALETKPRHLRLVEIKRGPTDIDELREEMAEVKQPWATEAMRLREEQMKAQILAEAEGDGWTEAESEEQKEKLLVMAAELQKKAKENVKVFPDLSAFQLARAAKFIFLAGNDISRELAVAKKARQNVLSGHNTISGFLTDAILIGLDKKMADGKMNKQ